MAEMKPVQLKVRSEADASATPACTMVKGQRLVSGSQYAGQGCSEPLGSAEACSEHVDQAQTANLLGNAC